MNAAGNTDDEQTSAIGLARYAYEYIEAARVVDEQIGLQNGYEIVSPIPAYWLPDEWQSMVCQLARMDRTVERRTQDGWVRTSETAW